MARPRAGFDQVERFGRYFDTCILKLATFPVENNASALIFELARASLVEAWVSPAILEEYADVLGDHPAIRR